MTGEDISEILKDIRDDLGGVRAVVHDVRAEVQDLRSDMNSRFALVEASIRDLAEQFRLFGRLAVK